MPFFYRKSVEKELNKRNVCDETWMSEICSNDSQILILQVPAASLPFLFINLLQELPSLHIIKQNNMRRNPSA